MTNRRTQCALDGCKYIVNKPDVYSYCSGICKELDKFLIAVEDTCRRTSNTELWPSAVDAVDAIHSVIAQRRTALKEYTNAQRSSWLGQPADQ